MWSQTSPIAKPVAEKSGAVPNGIHRPEAEDTKAKRGRGRPKNDERKSLPGEWILQTLVLVS